MSITIVIAGRPNVGKSTLFNRLIGQKRAIVNDEPGVTRDILDSKVILSRNEFILLDTPGINDTSANDLESRLRKNTIGSINRADLIIFVFDAKVGVTNLDLSISKDIRKTNKSILLVANKCDVTKSKENINDSYKFGFGRPILISAEHGNGIDELYNSINKFLINNFSIQENNLSNENESILKLSIVGRPNVGKSTIINYLINEKRLLTGPEAGLTRDSVELLWKVGSKFIKLIDTAGIRKQSKVIDRIESLSFYKTKKSIDLSEVVALVIDSSLGIDRQDLRIANLVIEEGRALVILLNKIDKVKDTKKFIELINYNLQKSLPQIKGVLILPISAKSGKGLGKLLKTILETYELWNKRISTSLLNKWLENVLFKHPPPSIRGRRIKIRYITQTKSRPPTFILFSTKADEVPMVYIKYLINDLRKSFNLPGVPIRFNIRKGNNPYDN